MKNFQHRIIRTLNNELNYKILPRVSLFKCCMARLYYMKLIGGLPTPRGSLSSSIPTKTIAEANNEVQKAVGTTDRGKRGP